MLAWGDTRAAGTVRLVDFEQEVGLLTEQLRSAIAPYRSEPAARERADAVSAAVVLTEMDQLVDSLARHFPRFHPRIRAAAWRRIATDAGAPGGRELAALAARTAPHALPTAS